MTYEIDTTDGAPSAYQYQLYLELVNRTSEAEQVVERKYTPNFPMEC